MKLVTWIRVATSGLTILFLGSAVFLTGCSDKPAASSTTNTSNTSTASSNDNKPSGNSTAPKTGPKRNKIKSLAGGEDGGGPSRGFKDQ